MKSLPTCEICEKTFTADNQVLDDRYNASGYFPSRFACEMSSRCGGMLTMNLVMVSFILDYAMAACSPRDTCRVRGIEMKNELRRRADR